jgi:hypothetical protein
MASDSDSESLPPLLNRGPALLNRGPEEEPQGLGTYFPQFPLLPVELQVLILSFVSEAPLSPVTHVLPFVSKQWRAMFISIEQYLRFTGLVFMAFRVVRLRKTITLHFLEKGYRILMQHVMEGYNVDNPSGDVSPRNGEYPTFVYAHMAPFAPTSPACLVEVRQCIIHPNQSADVILMPVAYGKIERMWEADAPNTERLHFAQCLRMGQEDSQALAERSNYRLELSGPEILQAINNCREQARREGSNHRLQSFANPSVESGLFANHPLLRSQLQRENAPAQMRAMLDYAVNDHGGMGQGNDDDYDSDCDVGMTID